MFDKFSIREMKIQGMKSVINGEVKFNKNDYSGGSLLGVYGQNGSGKTSIIDAVSHFVGLVKGRINVRLLQDIISKKTEKLVINIIFDGVKNGNEFEYHYESNFEIIENKVQLTKEIIKFKGDKIKVLKEIGVFEYLNKEERILPKITFGKLIDHKNTSYDDVIISAKESYDCKSSFFLNNNFLKIMIKEELDKDIYNILLRFLFNVKQNIFVIGTMESGISQMGEFIPLTIHKGMGDIKKSLKAVVPINLQERTFLDKEKFLIVAEEIKGISKSLNKIVPNVELEVCEQINRRDQNGIEIVEFDVITIRNGIKIPLRFESEGIKKIISIMSVIKSVYNNPNMIAFIDELDSGIFEYLIGELVEQISEYGKGQMLFTSHNFRLLEVLSHKNIYFSTTDENNRFVKMKNIGTNNNLRKKYYEAIQLGTDDAELYEPTEPFEIREGLGD